MNEDFKDYDPRVFKITCYATKIHLNNFICFTVKLTCVILVRNEMQAFTYVDRPDSLYHNSIFTERRYENYYYYLLLCIGSEIRYNI